MKSFTTRYGGEMEEYPRPWKLLFFDEDYRPREVTVKSFVFPINTCIGSAGHHHCDIVEERNQIWRPKDNCYGLPWRWDEDHEMYEAVKGRDADNNDLVSRKEVVKWAVGVLKEWGVLKNPKYKIVWDIDEDDPMTNSMLATYLRKRREEAD